MTLHTWFPSDDRNLGTLTWDLSHDATRCGGRSDWLDALPRGPQLGHQAPQGLWAVPRPKTKVWEGDFLALPRRGAEAPPAPDRCSVGTRARGVAVAAGSYLRLQALRSGSRAQPVRRGARLPAASRGARGPPEAASGERRPRPAVRCDFRHGGGPGRSPHDATGALVPLRRPRKGSGPARGAAGPPPAAPGRRMALRS